MPIDESQLTPPERVIYDTLNSTQKAIYLDLSDEVRRIVGRWAPQNGCTPDQTAGGVCAPDPRVTAQVGIRNPTDWDLLPADKKFSDRIYRYRLKDARKGDLLLSPGGPSGMIGAMLSALTPPQDYSHMGIVIEDDGFDGTVLRHCTASEDWLNRNLFATGTVFEGTPLSRSVPLRGFRSDAVRYLWPGTITQSVEVAFKSFYDTTYRAEVYELDGAGNYLWQQDENGKWEKILRERYAVLDPVRAGDDRGTNGRYRIAALTFGSVWVEQIGETQAHWADPLVVQPCLEKRSPAVQAALGRIADACKQLRGHYRLFAYTDGQIGMADDGPATLEAVTEPFCSQGVYTTDPVASTRGMVCSTFIWQAAQLANQAAGQPAILLDGRPQFPEPSSTRDDACAQLTMRWGRQRLGQSAQSVTNPVDGLYFYTEPNRGRAAEALQKKLVDKVMENVGEFLDTIAGPPLLGGLQGGLAGVTISWLLKTNPLTLALLLGVSKSYVDAQIEKVRETARHVSNQMGDLFRQDNAALDNDSDDWRQNPGTGNTVSPDDILNSWAAPHHEDADRVVGLYGSSIKAEVLSPTPIEGDWRPSTWEIATDRTGLGVRVYHPDANGSPVYLAGAVVRIGCAELITTSVQDMSVPQIVPSVPTGQYFAQATWTDPQTNFKWRSPRRIVTIPGPEQDIEVFPPRETRRHVQIHGDADLLNRHATDEIPVIGTDPWEKKVRFGSGWIPMGLDFSDVDPAADPEFYAWLQANHGADLKGLDERDWLWQEQMEDWGIARVIFTCKLDPSGTINLSVKGGMREGIDPTDNTEPEWGQVQTFTIPPKLNNADSGFQFTLKVERTGFGFPPVRATLRVTIDNNQQSG